MSQRHITASVRSMPTEEALGTTLRLGSLTSEHLVSASAPEASRDPGVLIPARTGDTLDGVGSFESVLNAATVPELRRTVALESSTTRPASPPLAPVAKRNPPPLPANYVSEITVEASWESDDERASGIFETVVSHPEPSETLDPSPRVTVEAEARRLTTRLLMSSATWAVLIAVACGVVFVTALDSVWTYNATSRGRGVLVGPSVHAVFAAISGEVEHVYVRQGDRVEAGDLLLSLTSATLHDQRLQSKRRLEIAERRLAELETTLEPHERALELLRTQAQLIQRQLGAEGDVREPAQVVNNAQLRLELELARTQVQVAVLEGELRDERERAQTKLEDARAADAALEQALEHLKVRAPASGRIRGVEVVAGDSVQNGQAIASLSTVTAPTEAVAFVSASDRKHLQLGSSVRIELDRFPAEFGALNGTVREIGSQLATREELQSVLMARGSAAVEPAYRVDIALSPTPENRRVLERLNAGTTISAVFDLGRLQLFEAAHFGLR